MPKNGGDALLQELHEWHQFWGTFLEGDNETLWRNVFDENLIENIKISKDILSYYYNAYKNEILNERAILEIQQKINQTEQ